MMRNHNGNAAVVLVVALALLFAAGPLTLHFLQKRHDELVSTAMTAKVDATTARGEIFSATLADIVEHELDGLTGWRPNDFLLWSPSLWADNNANRQRGIAAAVRKTTQVMKEHLTKISSNEYDARLVGAEAAFYNDFEKFWFPSAESKLREGCDALRKYGKGLRATPPTSRPIIARNIELIRLFQAWGDLLGDAHANLYKSAESDGSSIPPWRNDDYYYSAQGVAHVLHHMTIAVKREYEVDLKDRPSLTSLFDEVAAALAQAAVLKPVIVLDGASDGLTANHRRNLDAYVVEARQKMYSIREELEK